MLVQVAFVAEHWVHVVPESTDFQIPMSVLVVVYSNTDKLPSISRKVSVMPTVANSFVPSSELVIKPQSFTVFGMLTKLQTVSPVL